MVMSILAAFGDHRYCRASNFNALAAESTKALVATMCAFKRAAIA